MTVANSSGVVYVYDSLKQLQVVFPSVKTLSFAINANSSSIKKGIETGSLFRGGWNVPSSLFSSSDEPFFTSDHLCSELITEIIKNASVKKAIFVFDLNGNYLNKYKGILEAETPLGIRHEKIQRHALSNLPCHCPPAPYPLRSSWRRSGPLRVGSESPVPLAPPPTAPPGDRLGREGGNSFSRKWD
jgi:hypothetical protein